MFSFRTGAELLDETAGVRLGESTVERTTEAVGERIAEHFRNGRAGGGERSWDWFRDANGQTVGYVAIDATGVRQQGPRGGRADGRMAYVGMVFNPRPDRERVFDGLPARSEPMKARYVSGCTRWLRWVRCYAVRRPRWGWIRRRCGWRCRTGGAGLEDLLRANFPRVQAVILDFSHASEHLAKLAAALHADDEGAASERTKSWCRLLREEGGQVLVSVLECWDWPARKGLSVVRGEVLGYLRNRVHRMDYPTYEAAGWYIDAGAVESGCKTVVGQRLKGSGMRWGEAGSHAVCHVRALYRSEPSQWADFWRRSSAA